MTEEEARLLFDKAGSLPNDAVIVELGTYYGGSTLVLGSAYNRGKIFTIDQYEKSYQLYPENKRTFSLENSIKTFKENNCEHVQPIQGTNSEIAKDWSLPIDLLFIDADHKYESVKEDIEKWLPKVKLNGLVLFHDYDCYVDVTKAVYEAIEEKRITIIKKVGTMLLTQRMN